MSLSLIMAALPPAAIDHAQPEDELTEAERAVGEMQLVRATLRLHSQGQALLGALAEMFQQNGFDQEFARRSAAADAEAEEP